MHRFVVAAWAAWLVLSASAPRLRAEDTPGASEQAAREAFERGRVFYDSGAFDQAAAAFEEAYRLSGRDALLYNLYLAYRDANEQQKAADALRSYLAKVQHVENRAQLEARLSALDQGLARAREQRAREPQAAALPSIPTPAPEAPARPARSGRFRAGIALSSAGGALLASSIATGALTAKRERELEDGCDDKICPAELRGTAESGQRLARATDALLFGGLAVATTGVVLVVLDRRRRVDRAAAPRRWRAACWRGGCEAGAVLRF